MLGVRSFISKQYGFCIVFLLIFLSACFAEKKEPASQGPVVVATLKPLHSLLASLMTGRGKPTLLLEGAVSPHTVVLRPSQRRLVQEADLLIWIDASFEVFLAKAVAALDPARVLTLLKQPQLILLPQDSESGCGCHEAHEAHGVEELMDGHIWMDPCNALVIVRAICDKLVEIDPAGQALYEKNRQALESELLTLDNELKDILAPFQEEEFFVTHQAYAYFCHRYSLRRPTVILPNPEAGLSSQKLLSLHATLKTNPGKCVFSEPQFAKVLKKLNSFVKRVGGKIGEIDPLGSRESAGPGLYCLLLRRCANNMIKCFAGS